jgi:hypothetical protein
MQHEPRQDIFISHASADKPQFVYPLTDALSARDVTFWLDDAEIGWGDSIAGRINEGLRTSQFALLCLSQNFLRRPWPEAEMSAVLGIQNSSGIKTVLPLILNSKDDVLRQYPLLAGLAYREFSHGPDKLAVEIAGIVESKSKDADEVAVTVEGVHTGKLCHLRVPRRASVQWLATKAQSSLEVEEAFRVGPFAEFRIRWVLVDVKAEDEWLRMSRRRQRMIRALVASGNETRTAQSGRDRLEEIDVVDGTVFHLYAIEDEDFPPPAACASA